jgi:hypothetical protein
VWFEVVRVCCMLCPLGSWSSSSSIDRRSTADAKPDTLLADLPLTSGVAAHRCLTLHLQWGHSCSAKLTSSGHIDRSTARIATLSQPLAQSPRRLLHSLSRADAAFSALSTSDSHVAVVLDRRLGGRATFSSSRERPSCLTVGSTLRRRASTRCRELAATATIDNSRCTVSSSETIP